jgi:hypothetical protein
MDITQSHESIVYPEKMAALKGVLDGVESGKLVIIYTPKNYTSAINSAAFGQVLKSHGPYISTDNAKSTKDAIKITTDFIKYDGKKHTILVLDNKYACGLDFPTVSVLIIFGWDTEDEIQQVKGRIDRFQTTAATGKVVHILMPFKGIHHAMLACVHTVTQKKRKRPSASVCGFKTCLLAKVAIHILGDNRDTMAWVLKSLMVIFTKFALVECMLRARRFMFTPLSIQEKSFYQSITDYASLEWTSLVVVRNDTGSDPRQWLLSLNDIAIVLSVDKTVYCPSQMTSSLQPLDAIRVIHTPSMLVPYSENSQVHEMYLNQLGAN